MATQPRKYKYSYIESLIALKSKPKFRGWDKDKLLRLRQNLKILSNLVDDELVTRTIDQQFTAATANVVKKG
jgi:hypothetical protein